MNYLLTLPIAMRDEEFLRNLGQKLKEVRTAKGMNQVDVCSRLNMDKTYLSAIENGRQNPSILKVKQILEAMGVEPMELFRF